MNSPIVKSEIIEAYKELCKDVGCEEEMYIDDYIKYIDLHFDRLDFDKILDTDDDPNEFKLTYIADFISCCCFMWFGDDITDFYKKD